MERAVPGLRRRARRQRHAEERRPRGIHLRAVRRRLRADPRRDGRGDVHRQPPRPPHRGARSRRACRSSNICGRSSGARASTCPTICEAHRTEITLDTVELPPGEKAQLSLQLPAGVRDRVRAGDARRAVHRREGRADRERQTSRSSINNVTAPTGTIEMRPGPLRLSLENRTDRARAAGALDRRRRAARAARPAPAVPDRQAPVDQPDVPRHLPHRHARRRPAAQDHQPDLPVHRPEGLDRALRARRRPRRLRPGARAFPGAARDRRGRGRRRRQDHRRCGDGDVPDARPRASRRRCACARRCAAQRRARAARICCSRSASTKDPASRC